MSPAKGAPDPHASPGKQEQAGEVVCYVCETDITSRVKSKKEARKGEKGGFNRGLVELRSEGTGFAGGGDNMVQRQGTAFQC